MRTLKRVYAILFKWKLPKLTAFSLLLIFAGLISAALDTAGADILLSPATWRSSQPSTALTGFALILAGLGLLLVDFEVVRRLAAFTRRWSKQR